MHSRYSYLDRGISLLVVIILIITSFSTVVSANSNNPGNVQRPDVLSYEDMSIAQFDAKIVYGAKNVGTAQNPEYVWNLGSNANTIKYQIDYETTGDYELEPMEFCITVPKHLFKDRKNKFSDNFSLMLMEESEVPEGDESHEFVYRELADSILIYNRLTIDATQQGFIQICYELSKSSFEYVDNSLSSEFNTDLTIYKDNAEVMYASRVIDEVKVDTASTITSLNKQIADKSTPVAESWNKKWGTAASLGVTNPELYNYVVWQVAVNINATQPYYLSALESPSGTYNNVSVVGYRHGSEKKFSTTLNSNKLFNSGDTTYVYILVKFLKSAYAGKDKYVIDGDTTITLKPADGVDADVTKTIHGQAANNSTKAKDYSKPSSSGGSGSGTVFPPVVIPGGFSYTKPSPVYPTNTQSLYVYDGKGNGISNNYNYRGSIVNYQLEDLTDGKRNFLYEGITYKDVYNGYGYRETLSLPTLYRNFSSYGKTPVTYSLESDTTKIKKINTDINLGGDDYRFGSINVQYSFNSATNNGYRFVETSPNYRKYDILELYVKLNSTSSNYVSLGSINLSNGQLDFSDDYVKSFVKNVDGSYTITFNDDVDVVAYKIASENLMYSAHYVVKSYVQIKNSDAVLNEANEAINVGQRYIDVEHKAIGKITNGEGDVVCSSERAAIDRLIAIENKSFINKNDTLKIMDKVNQILRIGWDIVFYEGGQAQYGFEYIKQNGGTFYDLLPAGAYFDEDTLEVFADGTKLSISDYTVSYIDDFRKSDKLMVVIHVNHAAKIYKIRYQSLYSFDNMFDRGETLLNSVAYETDNAGLSKGFKDTGGGITERETMKNLDPDCTTARFVYAERVRHIVEPLAASLGLSKKIKKDSSVSYGKSIKVNQNEYYDYQIRYATTSNTRAKNMVIFDNIENYNAGDFISEWHGKLSSVNTSYVDGKGAHTIVYLSDQDLDFTVAENRDLTDDSLWHTMEEFGDISNARSIAFDMSKRLDGSDFILDSSKTMLVYYRMQAPNRDDREGVVNGEPYRTYNNVYLAYDLITVATVDSPEKIVSKVLGYKKTTAEFRIVADVPLHKVDIRDNDVAIEGIKFTLEGTSDYGETIKTTLATDRGGNIIFRKIPKGTYSLYEFSGNDDYLMDINTYTVVIDGDGKVFVNDEEVVEAYLLEDVPRIHTTVSFTKRDLVQKKRTLEGAKFRLTGMSDYGTYTLKFADSDENGIVSFANIEKGSYSLTEIAAPGGYVTPAVNYTVTVTEEANVIINSSSDVFEAHLNMDSTYDLYNAPYYSFYILKQGTLEVNGTSMNLTGAKFRLYGNANDGTYYDKERVTGTSGLALFSMVKAGVYVLQEMQAPEGYILDDAKRMVIVDDYGNITIDGLSKDYLGRFVFKNKENGSVIITKKWIDLPTSVRPNITINLSLSMPQSDVYIANTALSRYRGNYSDNQGSSSYTYSYVNSFRKHELSSLDENKVRVATLSKPSSTNVKLTDGNTYNLYRIDDNTTMNRAYVFKKGSVLYWWSNASDVHLTENASGLFRGLAKIQTIDLSDIDTTTSTNMSNMFKGDIALTKISGLDTSNVTDMSSMFYDCIVLSDVYSNNINTSNVLNMDYMFYHANYSSAFRGMNTENVTSMRYMFAYATNVQTSTFTGFNTSNVRFMEGMFNHAIGYLNSSTNVREFEINGWDVGEVIDIKDMFSYTKFDKITLKNLQFTNIENLSKLFYESCVRKVVFDNFETSNAIDMSYMFYDCVYLNKVNVEDIDVSNVTNIDYMFYGTGIDTLDFSTWDTSNIETMESAFAHSSLVALPTGFSTRDWSSLENCSNAFYSNAYLKNIDLASVDMPELLDASYMFCRCVRLESVTLEDAQFPKLNNTSYMFAYSKNVYKNSFSNNGKSVETSSSYYHYYDSYLKFSESYPHHSYSVNPYSYYDSSVSYVTLNSILYTVYSGTNFRHYVYPEVSINDDPSTTWDLNMANCSMLGTLNASYMFYDSGVGNIDMHDANLTNIDNAQYMMSFCRALSTIDVHNLDMSNANDLSYMVYNNKVLKSVNFRNVNMSGANNMSYMFADNAWMTTADFRGIISDGDPVSLCNMSYMFYECTRLVNLYTIDFDTSNAYTMSHMFDSCKNLKSFIVSNFDTSKCTDMSFMFCDCQKLNNISVINFDTSLVTDMEYMFANCYKLPIIDISTFNTSAVKYMNSMFSNCEILSSVNMDSINTASVQNMSYMFANCKSLPELYLGTQFSTWSCSNFSHMFYHCESLETLDLQDMFDISHNTGSDKNMDCMFSYCTSLTSLDLGDKFATSYVGSAYKMFEHCESLPILDVGDYFDFPEDMDYMFSDCYELTDIINLDTNLATRKHSMKYTFYNCYSYENIDIGNNGTIRILSMESTFENCNALKTVSISGSWATTGASINNTFKSCSSLNDVVFQMTDTARVTSAVSTFEGCSSLETLDLFDLDTGAVVSTSKMFKGCESLIDLDIEWGNILSDEPVLNNMSYMFQNCNAELILDLDTSKVTDMSYMFDGAKSSDLDLSSFDTTSVTTMVYMFRGIAATSLDISTFDTSNVSNMVSMFRDMTNITDLDLSNFDTSKVSSFSNMFSGSTKLENVNLTSFNTVGVNNMREMFSECTALTDLDLRSFNTAKLSNATNMFNGCSSLVTITASSTFVQTKLTSKNSVGMFTGCTAIVGGTGDHYDDSVTDKNGISKYFTFVSSTSSGSRTTTKVYTGIIKSTSTGAPANNGGNGDGNGDGNQNLDPSLVFTSNDANCEVEKIDNNTYQYTFTGMAPGVDYYVWEDELTTYVCDTDSLNVKKTVQGAATITNTQFPMPVGDLEVGVIVQPHSGELTDAERNEKFDYTFVIKDSEGKVKVGYDIVDCTFYEADGTAKDIAIVFENGVAHAQLAHNEKILIPKRFDKYKYETYQTENPNYTLTNPSNKNGTIVSEKVQRVRYINKKNYVTVDDTTTFKVKKVVTGDYIDNDKEFEFVADLSNMRANETYSYSSNLGGVTEFKSNDLGCAYLSFTLKNNEIITFTVAKDTFYRIMENGCDYKASYQIIDYNNAGLIVQDSGQNNTENVDLSTSVETADAAEDVMIIYTNEKHMYKSIFIEKELIGSNNTDETFSVSLYMEGLDANAKLTSSIGILPVDPEGVLDLGFNIRADEVIKIEGIPVGATYKIVESKCSYLAGYKMFMDSVNGSLVTSGTNNDTNRDLVINTRTIEAEYDPYILLSNEKIKCDVTIGKEIDMTYGIVPDYIYMNTPFEFQVSIRGINNLPLNEYVVDYYRVNESGSQQYTFADLLGLEGADASAYTNSVTFSVYLRCGDYIKIRDLPYKAFINITECASEDYKSSYVASVNSGGLLQSDRGSNEVVNQDLELTAEEYIDLSDRDIVFTFINTYQFKPYSLPSAGFEDYRVLIIGTMAILFMVTITYWYVSRKRWKEQ